MTQEHYDKALSVVTTLQQAGHIAYFVGGWVRDYVLDHPSDDIDIGTTATPEEITSLFEKTIPVGAAFGVVVVVIDTHQFEVATFREEEGYTDGRRPTSIKPANPEVDAQRRDFTINGLFFDPAKEQVMDYVEGMKDLKAGVVRAIGDPHERFNEDRLRMIRAVRYSARFDFTIEEDTLKAIKAHHQDLFPAVSIERIVQEMEKMARYPRFKEALILMHKIGLLGQIFPSLQEESHEHFTSLVKPLDTFEKGTPLILYLLHLVKLKKLEDKVVLCKRLKLPNKAIDLATFAHGLMPDLKKHEPHFIDNATWVKHYASPFFTDCLKVYLATLDAEKRPKVVQFHKEQEHKLRQAIKRRQDHTFLLTSRELIQLGIRPSPLLGTLLEESETIAINEGINDKQVLIARLQQSEHWPQTLS